MLIYIIYFIFIAVLAIQYEFTPFQNNYLLFIVAILLALFAGLRGPDVSKDYYSYRYIFDNIYNLTGSDNLAFLTIFEPGFLAIIILFRNFFELNYVVAIMLFYAFTSVFIKIFIIDRLSINPYLTILFYFSSFFLIHEMTQIRIGLASALFLLSILSLLKGKQMVFVGIILLATFFHYSAIFYLPLLLFNRNTFDKRLYTAVLLLSFIFAFLKLPLFSFMGNFDPSNISDKFSKYVDASENGSVTINTFNVLNIINILCCVYLIYFVDKQILIKNKKLILFLKCNILSIFLLSFLSGVPAFSMRFSELFSIAQLFLFTYLVKYLPLKKYNILILILVAGLFFYVNGFYSDLLHPYKMANFK